MSEDSAQQEVARKDHSSSFKNHNRKIDLLCLKEATFFKKASSSNKQKYKQKWKASNKTI